MTLEDAVKACEIAPRKVKLKIIRCVPSKAAEIDSEILVNVFVCVDSTVCVCHREDQPVNPKAKWNGKAL